MKCVAVRVFSLAKLSVHVCVDVSAAVHSFAAAHCLRLRAGPASAAAAAVVLGASVRVLTDLLLLLLAVGGPHLDCRVLEAWRLDHSKPALVLLGCCIVPPSSPPMAEALEELGLGCCLLARCRARANADAHNSDDEQKPAAFMLLGCTTLHLC